MANTPAPHTFSIPNLLTYARIVAVPLMVLCFFAEGSFQASNAARWWALAIFVIASITDYLDGYLARKWKQGSAIGKMLDPIADKLLVSVALLLLAAEGSIAGWSLWAAIIILCREILVSGLREFLGANAKLLKVTRLAKWKTTAQMVAISVLFLGTGLNYYEVGHPPLVGETSLPWSDSWSDLATQIGLALIWMAAVLTAITGWDYFDKARPFLRDPDAA